CHRVRLLRCRSYSWWATVLYGLSGAMTRLARQLVHQVSMRAPHGLLDKPNRPEWTTQVDFLTQEQPRALSLVIEAIRVGINFLLGLLPRLTPANSPGSPNIQPRRRIHMSAQPAGNIPETPFVADVPAQESAR